MTSKFLIQVRKIVHSIDTIDLSDNDINKLRINLTKLNEKITKTILRNPETGKKFLIANLLEFESENGYVRTKLRVKLEKLQDIGFGPYDAILHNFKEVLNCWDDATETLLKTYKTYFSQKKPSTELSIQPLETISNNNTNEPVNNTDKQQKETKKIDAIMFVAICRKLNIFHHTDGKTDHKERARFLKNELSENPQFRNIEIKQAWKFTTIHRNVKRLLNENDPYFKHNYENISDLINFIESD